MANFGANLELIPVSLVADTEAELSRLCFIANTINSTKFNFALPPNPPSKGTNNKWVIWFYADIKDYQDPNELTEEQKIMIQEFIK